MTFIKHHSRNDFKKGLCLGSELSHHLSRALFAKATIHARLFLGYQISQPDFLHLAITLSVKHYLVFKEIGPLVRDVLAELRIRVYFGGETLCSLSNFCLLVGFIDSFFHRF